LVNGKIKKKTNKKNIIQINNVLHSYQTWPDESSQDPGDLGPWPSLFHSKLGPAIGSGKPFNPPGQPRTRVAL